MRLDKLLAHAGFGTRKKVKEIIKKGKVTVDREIVKKGNVHVDPDEQLIEVNNQKVHYQKYVYIMLHKPANYISATVDKYDLTVLDLIPEKYAHYELAPVGRLDKDTEGLLLLTNDGALNHAITSPKREVWKTYFAKVAGTVTEKNVDQFREGIVLEDGYKTKEAHLEIVKSGLNSDIKLSITEGKYHQVKRMFQAVGMEVIYLKRLRIGNLDLGDLSLGKMRLLTEEELNYVLSLKK